MILVSGGYSPKVAKDSMKSFVSKVALTPFVVFWVVMVFFLTATPLIWLIAMLEGIVSCDQNTSTKVLLLITLFAMWVYLSSPFRRITPSSPAN